MLKKILVPLDGSENAYKALDFAIDLAKICEARLWIMHVIDEGFPLELEKAIVNSDVKDVINSVRTQLASRKIFEKAGEKIKSEDVRFTTYSVTGNPAKEIITYADTQDMDLIVIGKTGLGKTKQFLFGSVTDKVARHAPCSVTIVR